jgi:hypothetical protein
VQAYIDGRLAVWTQRLRLQDWTASVILSQPSDLRPGTLGNIHWDPAKKTVVIRVLLPPDGGKPGSEGQAAMEETVVHELVHLELALLPKTDSSRLDEESAVDRIASALLDLERKPPVSITSYEPVLVPHDRVRFPHDGTGGSLH